MDEHFLSKKEASKILGVTTRMVEIYLQKGKLPRKQLKKNKVMIPIRDVYNLRAEKKGEKLC